MILFIVLNQNSIQKQETNYQAIYFHSCQLDYGPDGCWQTILCDDASEQQQMLPEADNLAPKQHMPVIVYIYSININQKKFI